MSTTTAILTAARSASPLAPVLAFTGLSSFACGGATLGIFFVTERAYAFSAVEQYALGLLVGVTYTAGALGARSIRRAFARGGRSARGTLALFSCAMAALMLVPLATPSRGALFALLGVYAAITGAFWPIVEQFVSGGRRGAELRSAIGRFNIVWSATLLPSFWILSPLLARSSGLVFAGISLAHLISLLVLLRLHREAGEHEAESAHAVPASYPALLRVHRVLHATAYLVMYSLSPALPGLVARLEVWPSAESIVASTWLFARVLTFAGLERWHGWHGRPAAAWGGAGAVVGGFALTVAVPHLAVIGGGLQIALVLLGLGVFGVGLATLYTAALYYAFEVGGSESGGSHEALIGLGYSLGPLCGLFVCGLEQAGTVAEGRRETVLLLLVAGIALGSTFWVWRRRRG
jgi:hypothetical protein